jgi:hypothetical protein
MEQGGNTIPDQASYDAWSETDPGMIGLVALKP